MHSNEDNLNVARRVGAQDSLHWPSFHHKHKGCCIQNSVTSRVFSCYNRTPGECSVVDWFLSNVTWCCNRFEAFFNWSVCKILSSFFHQTLQSICSETLFADIIKNGLQGPCIKMVDKNKREGPPSLLWKTTNSIEISLSIQWRN